MKHILFVCTGNTCRSPMAEYLWNSTRNPHRNLAVADSAGLTAFENMPISDNALEALQAVGIDASAHRARLRLKWRINMTVSSPFPLPMPN